MLLNENNKINRDLFKLFDLKENEIEEIVIYNDEMCLSNIVYLSKINNELKVSIPFEEETKEVNRCLQNIRLFNETLIINDKNFDVLSLSIKEDGDEENSDLESFLLLCNDFIYWNDNDYNEYLTYPEASFNKEIQILKYFKYSTLVKDTISELVVLHKLYLEDNEVKWGIVKNESRILIDDIIIYAVPKPSDYALELKNPFFKKRIKDFYVVNLKLDKDGETINSLVQKMIDIGYKEEGLEEVLTTIGLIKNSIERDISYKIESIE